MAARGSKWARVCAASEGVYDLYAVSSLRPGAGSSPGHSGCSIPPHRKVAETIPEAVEIFGHGGKGKMPHTRQSTWLFASHPMPKWLAGPEGSAQVASKKHGLVGP